ncbi:MAG: glycosyltransferase family 2 protein [Candidatus Omnitrophica bacterium]|nr:glycosyltransferase family 2 protein [Candidatus Omnitrophota bacterium]
MDIVTPVVFMIFNRPHLTERVFKAIAQAKPTKLFVVADGPRDGQVDDIKKCAAARTIIEEINWDCEVIKNYADTNLGCKRRISSGLDWVFSKVEEAIILEDDCLPAPSFFYFCQTLLEHYRYDGRVTHIGGSNFQFGTSKTNYSYYFSQYPPVWGWATWRRAWQYYDVDMKTWPGYKKSNMVFSAWKDPYERKYWIDTLDCMFEGKIDTWDYQWHYACLRQNGLAIIPKTNLISNIGFGSVESTHCVETSPYADLPTTDIWEIKHPSFVMSDRKADNYIFYHNHGGNQMRERDTLKWKIIQYFSIIKKKLKNLINTGLLK